MASLLAGKINLARTKSKQSSGAADIDSCFIRINTTHENLSGLNKLAAACFHGLIFFGSRKTTDHLNPSYLQISRLFILSENNNTTEFLIKQYLFIFIRNMHILPFLYQNIAQNLRLFRLSVDQKNPFKRQTS